MQSAKRLDNKSKGQLRLLQKRVRCRNSIKGRSYVFRGAVRIMRWENACLSTVSTSSETCTQPIRKTHIRWQNDGRRRIVKFCNIEWLRDEISWIELVEGYRASRSLCGLIDVGHTHGAKLLGYLRDSWSSWGSISRYCGLYLTWFSTVHGLLVAQRLRLGRKCSIAAPS